MEVWREGKIRRGRKGKSICTAAQRLRGLRGLYSAHPINFVSDREQRPLLTYYSTLVGITLSSLIRITHIALTTFPRSADLSHVPYTHTHADTGNNEQFFNAQSVFVRIQHTQMLAEIQSLQTAIASPRRLLLLGYSELSRFGAVHKDVSCLTGMMGLDPAAQHLTRPHLILKKWRHSFHSAACRNSPVPGSNRHCLPLPLGCLQG